MIGRTLILAAIGLPLILAACVTGGDRSRPVGTEGFGPERFPQSPCACVEIEQAPVTPDYRRALERWLG